MPKMNIAVPVVLLGAVLVTPATAVAQESDICNLVQLASDPTGGLGAGWYEDGKIIVQGPALPGSTLIYRDGRVQTGKPVCTVPVSGPYQLTVTPPDPADARHTVSMQGPEGGEGVIFSIHI